MTENEAIEELNNSIISYEVQNPNNITCDLTTEVLDVAIQALEKQIQKKPIDRCIYKECPTCGNVEIEFCKHCPDCGQKLDWSDVE